MTYNVHGSDAIRDEVIGGNIAAALTRAIPDFAALQECVDCEQLLARLDSRFELANDPEVGISILYDAARWALLEQDDIVLGENDDGWGKRHARRGMFENLASGVVVQVYSTHWCVTIRSPDDACDVSRQTQYADAVLEDIRSREPVPTIVAGDLNLFDEFEDGPVLRHLIEGGLADPMEGGRDHRTPTFVGNEWAPPGRIDYVLAVAPEQVFGTKVDDKAIDASDHYPVIVRMRLR